MDFSFDFNPTAWALLGLAFACALTAFAARWLAVARTARTAGTTTGDHQQASLPKTTVIVYSTSDEQEITRYLERAMDQDHPDYDLVLVNEGSAETTHGLAERLTAIWPERLYVTFIPSDAHNLSRRKLALTVGMKAASGDVVVTTTANASIPSRNWLSDLTAPLNQESKDVALGYSHPDFSELHGPGKWYRSMDFTLTACMWIGAAAKGNPYRGDGTNLAFRRRLFFDNKGYARTIHMVNGDDDLFLKEIMTPQNTAVSISLASILTTEWDSSAAKVLSDIKERYAFTARFLPKGPFLRAGLGSAMQWAVPALGVAAIFIALPSLVPVAVAVALTGSLWLAEIIVYRKAAAALGSPRLWWSLPWMAMWLPVGNFLFRWRHRRVRKHYTFQ